MQTSKLGERLQAMCDGRVALSKAEAIEIVGILFGDKGLIMSILREENELAVPGFGKFRISKTGGTLGRNPATNEQIMLPVKKSVKFKASSTLTP